MGYSDIFCFIVWQFEDYSVIMVLSQKLTNSFVTLHIFIVFQNLNKQSFDLAKVLLKRTVQTIEACIANVCISVYIYSIIV